MLWYRLHYTVIPKTAAASTNISQLEGFISLSEITPELFELRVAGPGGVREGTVYQALVHAVHPITNGPAKGVQIKASATLTDDITEKNLVLTYAAITDGEGYATLKFQLPRTSAANEFQLKIEGTRGFLTSKIEKEIDINLHGEMAVSTDKPIYQPGQTLHARALLLGASKRALAYRNVTLKIKDPEDAVAFSVELKTSRFGIASADWPIPEHTRLGSYSLQFSTGEDQSSYSTVKISRYDLPNFVVNVKTDRPYYLPGQDATITVRGDYLFGEPVRRGQVRVVRDLEQRWNYQEQKYETTEGDVFKGELDSNQTFTVRVPLSDDFKELNDQDYSRFEDLHLTAFVTDASTNRTEQRRFDVRLSKENIHVYATRPGDSYRESASLPLTIYVSTFYPDGTPAPCNVIVTEGDPDDYDEGEKPPIVGRVKTNRYGVGKLSSPRTPTVENSYLKLNFTAHDKNRKKGTRLEEFYSSESDHGIRINTTKTVYAPGEQIPANIITTKPSMAVALDVVRDWTVIQSQLIHVRDGRASILLPYKPEFKGQITLVAHAEKDDDSRLSDSRTIIYPHPRDLKLKLQSTAETYRPGDQASVSFKALSAGGSSVESALGIVVFDRAVEERARTDAEYGRYEGFVDAALGLGAYGDSVGNVSVKTLEKLDLSKPVPADLDLAAEILLNRSSSYFFDSFTSDDYTKDFRSVFVMRIADQLEPLRTILTNTYQKTMTYPTNESSLRQFLSNHGLDLDTFKDPWGMPYRPSFANELQSDVFVLESAGADKRFDTEDDITSAKLSWPYFRPTGEAINKAVATFHQRTGGFIRDFKTLRDELMPLGINLDTLKDRWLKPYTFTFDVVGTNLIINVLTTNPAGYPFNLWQSRVDYFAELRARIDSKLNEHTRATRFPESRAQMRDALLAAGIDLDSLQDPWGHPYYVTFSTLSLYGDKARMEARTLTDGAGTKQTLELKPVTSVLLSAKFRSLGPDAKEGTPDDFDVATFSVTRSQQSASDAHPRPVPIIATFSGATGVITGTVTDNQGAAIPGAKVSATASGITEVFTATSNDDGRYVLRNLPPATYQVSVEAAAFKSAVITNVVVQATAVFELNVTLEVGGVSETVSVSASSEATIITRQLTDLPLNGRSVSHLLLDGVSRKDGVKPPTSVTEQSQQPFSTPRLREYFPETLLWQPELITDKNGNAKIDFKLADNITTWKMAVIGSTETGEIGIAETEIKTFQPFFAELDPPQILTQGDQISLPVVLRKLSAKNTNCRSGTQTGELVFSKYRTKENRRWRSRFGHAVF
ncbi:MAG TPA: MG2 domain-containing protein [Pyrinomonadaceae bacterium]